MTQGLGSTAGGCPEPTGVFTACLKHIYFLLDLQNIWHFSSVRKSSFNSLYGGVPLLEFWKRETGSNYSLVFDQLLQMSLGSEKGCVDFLREISLWFLCWVAAAHWGMWDFGVRRKRTVSRGPLNRKAAFRPSSAGAETILLVLEVRSVRLRMCLNSLLNLEVNAILGEAPKAENTTYTIMSDQCIQHCPLSLCWVTLHLH